MFFWGEKMLLALNSHFAYLEKLMKLKSYKMNLAVLEPFFLKLFELVNYSQKGLVHYHNLFLLLF